MKFNFKAFNDPVLENMLLQAESFAASWNGRKQRWLSFVGPSGTGKTYLSGQLFQEAHNLFSWHNTLLDGCIRVFWPKLVSQLRSGEYHRLADLAIANFVFIDEIVVEHDPNGFAKDKLCELLSSRCGRWTLLTSNLSMEKLGNLDARIPSRMVRDGSMVVGCNTTDFALRK